MNIFKFLFIILFIITLTNSLNVSACMYETSSIIENSDIIFVGKLVLKNQSNTEHIFVPSMIWKGSSPDDFVKIKSSQKTNLGVPKPLDYSSKCGAGFYTQDQSLMILAEERDYLVMASKYGSDYTTKQLVYLMPIDETLEIENKEFIDDLNTQFGTKEILKNQNYRPSWWHKNQDFIIGISIFLATIIALAFYFKKPKK